MSKYVKTLLNIAVIISLTASSAAFADSIHKALNTSQVDQSFDHKVSGFKRKSSPWTMQEYVREALQAIEISKNGNRLASGWQEALGNPPKL